MKIAIVYASLHHGNTKKLVHRISDVMDITLINAEQPGNNDLSDYDLIGFASGIDFGKFYNSVEVFLREHLPENKNVFFLYTCAKSCDRFTKSIRKEAMKQGAIIRGEFSCKGYNTYGPWKLIGGMNKNHPTEQEIEDAIRFVKSLTKA